MIRRLLALLLLAAGLVLGVLAGAAGPASAAGCRPAGDTLERQTMRADAVFSGVVAEREVAGQTVTYVVDVDLVYKGDVQEQMTVETPRRQCALPTLEAGDDLLWFTGQDGDRVIAARGDGTTSASPSHLQRVQNLLGSPQPAAAPEPVEATFTTVGGEPAEVSRLVAPGLALVLAGLLGLLLVGALGRRRG